MITISKKDGLVFLKLLVHHIEFLEKKKETDPQKETWRQQLYESRIEALGNVGFQFRAHEIPEKYMKRLEKIAKNFQQFVNERSGIQ